MTGLLIGTVSYNMEQFFPNSLPACDYIMQEANRNGNVDDVRKQILDYMDKTIQGLQENREYIERWGKE